MYMMHLDGIDINQVRLLAALAELGSLSGAAGRIGLSQSAASHALAKLRQRVGDPLFVRTANGLHPTPYGERLGLAARNAVEALLDGFASMRAFDPRTSTRRFNVYLSDVGQMVFLPKFMSYLNAEAPGSDLRVFPVPLDNPGTALASGEVDLAVGFFTNLASGFRQSLVFRERYVCVVRTDHPRFRTGMSTEAFLASPRALADASGMAHTIVEQTLTRHGLGETVKLRVPEFMVLPLVIANSDLLVIMPSRLAQAFAQLVPIKVLRAPVPLPPYDIRAYWHERYHNDPAINWLRRSFVRLFRTTAQA
jgi:DNA-binding transcriptional LysR family regulator